MSVTVIQTRSSHSTTRMGPRGAGFTLLEVLVAAAVTALLVGFIVVLVANVSGFWTRSSGRLSAEAQARFMLDQLTLDLQSALFRDDGNVALAADILVDSENSGLWDRRPAATEKPFSATGTPLRHDAAALSESSFGRAGVWLRFFTTKRGSNIGAEHISAPVAVGWQIIRRPATGDSTSQDFRYFLHRTEVQPALTLESGFDITAAAYSSVSTLPILGRPHTVRSPPRDAIIGDNVIDFGVRCFVHDRNGALTQVFPLSVDAFHRASSPSGVGLPSTQFPEVIEVMVRILSDEGARLIGGFEASPQRVMRPPEVASDADYWWPLALAHSHVFTRRIVLPAQSH